MLKFNISNVKIHFKSFKLNTNLVINQPTLNFTAIPRHLLFNLSINGTWDVSAMLFTSVI